MTYATRCRTTQFFLLRTGMAGLLKVPYMRVNMIEYAQGFRQTTGIRIVI